VPRVGQDTLSHLCDFRHVSAILETSWLPDLARLSPSRAKKRPETGTLLASLATPGTVDRAGLETEADFEIWYKQYPKHVDKADARKAYLAVIKKKLATPEQLLAAAMRYAAERTGQDPPPFGGIHQPRTHR
jgi:hypothetical protein